MKFHHHLYLGSGIKNKEKIIRKLKYGAGMRNIYVISLSRGRDQLDCTHCCYLKQRKLRNHLGLVVGLANGQEEMTEVVIVFPVHYQDMKDITIIITGMLMHQMG